MVQGLLQVGDLARQLALGRLILGVLLLNLWQVLKLNGFPFENGPLHIFNHLLLLLPKLLVLQFHSVNLFLHGDDLSLTDRWVEVILHFFLKLDLPLPEQNLPLSFHDLRQDVGLLLLEVRNIILKPDTFILKFLQLLLELIFYVEVIILEFFLQVSVLVE